MRHFHKLLRIPFRSSSLLVALLSTVLPQISLAVQGVPPEILIPTQQQASQETSNTESERSPKMVIPSETTKPNGGDLALCCPPLPLPPVTTQTVTDIIVLIDSTQIPFPYSRWSGDPEGREYEKRLAILQWVALDLADSIPEQVPAAFVSLSDEASSMRQLVPFDGDERSQLRRSIMNLKFFGGGKFDKLLAEASRLLIAKPEAVPLIVLVTDGMECDPSSDGEWIRRLHHEFQDRLHFQVVGICDNTLISGKLRELASQAGNNGDYTSISSVTELPSALVKVRASLDAVVERRTSESKWYMESLNHYFCEFKEYEKKFSEEEQGHKATKDKLKKSDDNLRAAYSDCKIKELKWENEIKEVRAELGRRTQERDNIAQDRNVYRKVYLTWLWIAFATLVALLVVALIAWSRTARLRDRIQSLTTDIAKMRDETETQGRQLKCCEDHLAVAECNLRIAENRQKDDAEKISNLNREKQQIEDELGDCKEVRRVLEQDVLRLGKELSTTSAELRDATNVKTQQQKDITTLTGEREKEAAKAEQLEIQVRQLEYNNIQLRADLVECKTGRAASEERALGATREMAANKKDSCPSQFPPIVTGPTIGHALGGSAPNGQGGVGGQGGCQKGDDGSVDEGTGESGGGFPLGLGTSVGGKNGKKKGLFETLAPAAGTAIGTAIGGPPGGVVGGIIGSLASGIPL